ncbi:CAP domain-containing protein [Nocardioides litoris]|uniref:CAP domain-containing protein n=1 Tax=Nocardioides litoris TaxID=1926648 RepID=UPI00111FBDB4|nr:CAP domain-containing protein [Nocardioides litoris]
MRRSPHAAVLAACLVLPLLGPVPTPASAAPAAPPVGVLARKAPTTVSGWSTSTVVVRPGRAVSFRVRVAGPPRRVLLQRRLGTRWVRADAARTTRTRFAVLRWTPPARAGSHTLRVRVPATRTRRAATTRPRTVRVVPASAPTSTPDPHDATEREVLRLVNQARATPRTCGPTPYAAAPPLSLEPRLGRAAGLHAADMARRGYFSHVSPEGSTPRQRIEAQGYRWRAWGENIAAAYPTPAQVVQGWLQSPAHCSNTMSTRFTQLGVGHVHDPASDSVHYWVQKFAAPL